MADTVTMTEVQGSGGNADEISTAVLEELKTGVDEIVTDMESGVAARRLDGIYTRFCEWSGQSADGRKHKEQDPDGKVPFPFNECCDNRVRLADMIVNERVMLKVLSALRAPITVKGIEHRDADWGARMTRLIKWVRTNILKSDYLRQLALLANYTEGDSPAAAICSVTWERDQTLRMEEVSASKLAGLYLSMVMNQVSPDQFAAVQEELVRTAADMVRQVLSPEVPEETAATVLRAFFQNISPKTATRVVKELRRKAAAGDPDPAAEFPVPWLRRNAPRVSALRMYEDAWIPANTTDFQRGVRWYQTEWLTAVELRSRVVSHGWKRSFVDKVLRKGEDDKFELEGKASFPDMVRSKDGRRFEARAASDYRGYFQVVTAQFRATNEDGIPGVYAISFHKDVDEAAHGRRLVDYHGDYSGVMFVREFLSSRMLDSRGVPELAETNQALLKLFQDTFGNHALLNTVPTLLSKGRRSTAKMKIGMLEEVRLRSNGDVKALQLASYPSTADKQQVELRRLTDEYFGRPNEEVPPALVELHQQWMVMVFLEFVREMWCQILRLCQKYLPDEALQQITGASDEQIFQGRSDIQGEFDLEISFDPRDLDIEYVAKVAEIMQKAFMPLDRQATTDWNVVHAALFRRFDPELAEAALRPVEEADQSEIEEEEIAWVKALAGIETPPQETGQNYQLRLQWLQQRMDLIVQNPEVFAEVAPGARQIIEDRYQHLTFMVQQMENAVTGRVGV